MRAQDACPYAVVNVESYLRPISFQRRGVRPIIVPQTTDHRPTIKPPTAKCEMRNLSILELTFVRWRAVWHLAGVAGRLRMWGNRELKEAVEEGKRDTLDTARSSDTIVVKRHH